MFSVLPRANYTITHWPLQPEKNDTQNVYLFPWCFLVHLSRHVLISSSDLNLRTDHILLTPKRVAFLRILSAALSLFIKPSNLPLSFLCAPSLLHTYTPTLPFSFFLKHTHIHTCIHHKHTHAHILQSVPWYPPLSVLIGRWLRAFLPEANRWSPQRRSLGEVCRNTCNSWATYPRPRYTHTHTHTHTLLLTHTHTPPHQSAMVHRERGNNTVTHTSHTHTHKQI